MSKLFIISLTLFFFYEVSAYAYIDPGLGSIILQAILGAIAACFSYCVFYWNKVKNFFLRVFKKKKKTD